ncbi:MAG: hypothetical protein IT429_14350 [Gemmataceae bacterium]|nr:hypothetical protein [Gemmataceae bacterium]
MSDARDPLWRKGPTQHAASDAPRRARGGKFYAVLALLLAVLGATAAVLFFFRKVDPPTFLGVWIDQYNDVRIPPNAFAANDRQALSDGLRWYEVGAFASQEARLFRQRLHKLRTYAAGEPLVVLLSAHVVMGPKGAVYVLPADARLGDETTWIPLAEVLDNMRACPTRQKLLILDLMQPFTAPRLGILADDVAARVEAALAANAAQDPALQTLMACAPGQQSLASPELQHTAFAYYLREGLRGRADGYGPDGQSNGQVSVRELARFVAARVDRWARQTRDARQTPKYRGTAADFMLMPAASAEPVAPGSRPAPSYPKWLLAQWQKRDRWRQGPGPAAPRPLLLQLEAILLEAERRMDDGADLAVIQTRARELLGPLDTRYAAWQAKLPTPPVSLAAEVVRAGKAPAPGADTLTAYDTLLTLVDRVQAAPKPDEKDREKLQTDRTALLKQFQGKPVELAWMVLEGLVREAAPSQARVQFIHGLLTAAKIPGYEETALLKRLATQWKGDPKDWPGAAARLALDVGKTAAQVEAAVLDPRVVPWVTPALDAARKKRLAAHALLFTPETAPEEIRDTLDDALRAYRAAGERVQVLSTAYQVRDDGLVKLAGSFRYFEELPEAGAWRDAVETARQLRDLLHARPATAKEVDEATRKIGKVSDTLQIALAGTLVGPVETRFRDLMGRKAKAGSADWAIMNALLRLPWWTAGERETLWQTTRQVSGRLHDDVLRQDYKEDTTGARTPAPPPLPPAPPARRLALQQARSALTLLQLDGGDTKGLEEALDRAAREPSDEAAWREVGAGLRAAWEKLTGGPAAP